MVTETMDERSTPRGPGAGDYVVDGVRFRLERAKPPAKFEGATEKTADPREQPDCYLVRLVDGVPPGEVVYAGKVFRASNGKWVSSKAPGVLHELRTQAAMAGIAAYQAAQVSPKGVS